MKSKEPILQLRFRGLDDRASVYPTISPQGGLTRFHSLISGFDINNNKTVKCKFDVPFGGRYNYRTLDVNILPKSISYDW